MKDKSQIVSQTILFLIASSNHARKGVWLIIPSPNKKKIKQHLKEYIGLGTYKLICLNKY